jgi:hypothetical protein
MAQRLWDERREELRRGIIGAVLACAIASAAAAQQDWESGGSQDGIALAFRDDAQLGAREVRAIAEVPHPAGRVVAIACDFTQALDPDVREARILSGDLNTRYSIYLRYAARFMVVAARDVVIDVRRQPNGCAWSEQPGVIEQRADAVRMPLLRGSWTIEALDEARARVTYQIAVNPGGRIPQWMVRRGAAGALPRVIQRVSECLTAAPAPNTRCAAK